VLDLRIEVGVHGQRVGMRLGGKGLEGSGFGPGTAVFNDVRQMSICKRVSSYHGVYSFVFEL
jgi:hypothetical protein